MKTNFTKAIVLFTMLIQGIAFSQVEVKDLKINVPTNPGSREVTITYRLQNQNGSPGGSETNTNLKFYYSDSKEKLNNLNSCPSINCEYTPRMMREKLYKIILPHRDHKKPNDRIKINSTGEILSIPEFLNKIITENFNATDLNLVSFISNLSQYYKDDKNLAAGNYLNNKYTLIKNDLNPTVFNNPNTVYYKCVITSNNSILKTEEGQFIMPRLFIIGIMGDSYTAGEGAPDDFEDKLVQVKEDAEWSCNIDGYSKNCNDAINAHRSFNSGIMQAINKLIITKPELGIRWVNVSSSGAKIENLFEKIQKDDNGNFKSEIQLKKIDNWMKENNRKVVDIMFVGIGGNDIGFADIVANLMGFSLLDPAGVTDIVGNMAGSTGSDLFPGMLEKIKKAIGELNKSYERLDGEIRSNYSFDVGKIIIQNYPNMTKGPNGDFCGPQYGSLTGCWNIAEKGISQNTFKTLHDDVLVKLNQEIDKAATKNNWYVAKIYTQNQPHGWCNCDEPFFNTIGASANDVQGDIFGTMHPNENGYEKLYETPIYDKLTLAITDWHKEFENGKENLEKLLSANRANCKLKLKTTYTKYDFVKIPEKYQTKIIDKIKNQKSNSVKPIKKSVKKFSILK